MVHRVGRDHGGRAAVRSAGCATGSARARAYTWLLVLGSLPVMGDRPRDTTTRRSCRSGSAIGAIGASFVITQYHTSVMFAPNCVGTANATTAGWGNLGGGVTQIAMPLLLAARSRLGVSERCGWRVAMVVPGRADAGDRRSSTTA